MDIYCNAVGVDIRKVKSMKKLSLIFVVLIVCLMGGVDASARVDDFWIFSCVESNEIAVV